MIMALPVRHAPAPPVHSALMAPTLTLELLGVQVSYRSVSIVMCFEIYIFIVSILCVISKYKHHFSSDCDDGNCRICSSDGSRCTSCVDEFYPDSNGDCQRE